MKVAGFPQFLDSHRPDIVARFGKQNEDIENPDEHRVFLELFDFVGDFGVKTAKPKRNSQRNGDNRLD